MAAGAKGSPGWVASCERRRLTYVESCEIVMIARHGLLDPEPHGDKQWAVQLIPSPGRCMLPSLILLPGIAM